MNQPSSAPVLRFVRATPSAAEIAAVTAVLLSLRATAAEPDASRSDAGRWADPAAALGQLRPGQLRPGPGAWRASSR